MRGLILVRAPAFVSLVAPVAALTLTCLLLQAADARAAAGFLDPTFGSGGFTILDEPIDVNERLEDLVVQPDGKILAAGARNGANGFLLARFNADGSPDLGFGVGGISVLPFAGPGETGSPRVIADIERRADGTIVAAGLGEGLGANAILLARYLPNGELDTSWGKGGLRLVAIAPYATAHGLALAPDGKIVVVGESENYAPVVRLTEGGKNDETFGPVGIREVDVPGVKMEDARAVKVLADGTVLLAGQAGSKGAFLAELDVNGEKVVGFGLEGIETQNLGTDPTPSGSINDIEVLADGRILATGIAHAGGADSELVVARFKPNGELDPTFATGGIFRSNPTPGRDAGEALEVQPDGKIVVAGLRGEEAMETLGDTFLLRLSADGQLDPTFGAGGESVASASPGVDQAAGLALQPDGRPVIAGWADVAGAHQLLVGRFTGPEAVKVTTIQNPRPKSVRCAGRVATIVGGPKADRIKGTKGADVIVARGGNDRISAGAGNDLVCAGGGRDVVSGGKGRDRVHGEGGGDRLGGGPGKDVCDGGPGKDVAAGSCERQKSA